MRFLCVLCALCGCAFQASALDREAFTFTNYDLDVRVEPEQQRLAVRGKLTLRNDCRAWQTDTSQRLSQRAEKYIPTGFLDSRLAVNSSQRETGAIRHPALHLGYRPHGRAF